MSDTKCWLTPSTLFAMLGTADNTAMRYKKVAFELYYYLFQALHSIEQNATDPEAAARADCLSEVKDELLRLCHVYNNAETGAEVEL